MVRIYTIYIYAVNFGYASIHDSILDPPSAQLQDPPLQSSINTFAENILTQSAMTRQRNIISRWNKAKTLKNAPQNMTWKLKMEEIYVIAWYTDDDQFTKAIHCVLRDAEFMGQKIDHKVYHYELYWIMKTIQDACMKPCRWSEWKKQHTLRSGDTLRSGLLGLDYVAPSEFNKTTYYGPNSFSINKGVAEHFAWPNGIVLETTPKREQWMVEVSWMSKYKNEQEWILYNTPVSNITYYIIGASPPSPPSPPSIGPFDNIIGALPPSPSIGPFDNIIGSSPPLPSIGPFDNIIGASTPSPPLPSIGPFDNIIGEIDFAAIVNAAIVIVNYELDAENEKN